MLKFVFANFTVCGYLVEMCSSPLAISVHSFKQVYSETKTAVYDSLGYAWVFSESNSMCSEIHKPHNLVNPHGPHRTAGFVTCLDLWPHLEYVRNAVAFWPLQQYSRSDGVIWSNNVNLFLLENGTDFKNFFPQDFLFLQPCTGTVLIPCMRNQSVYSWKLNVCMTASMQSQKRV